MAKAATDSKSVALLVDVDAIAPALPDLYLSEHAAGATHVSKDTLASVVSAAAKNAGDTRDSATSAHDSAEKVGNRNHSQISVGLLGYFYAACRFLVCETCTVCTLFCCSSS
ncbi:hypothetical protein LOK49_LG01G01730 [Camellia lanceoleosa]|uniref:Uncharacterized protein n=1 Tax=Camellia lanceoleosa TaxID=1840588 RepID=A0ACC0IVA7_9ERIC|nr:hypothetical protein LOK49_LG01G01730 [Camellia lanceoleosa]